MKRFRRKKLNDGELKVYWGKMPGQFPELIYSYQGDDIMRRDIFLMLHVLENKRPNMTTSLVEELDSRGYDITTLQFSIMKKS